MPLDGKIIAGMWYVDCDDEEGRLNVPRLWRKLSVRLAGTLGPSQEAALVNLRGWWEKWHGSDGAYQEQSAKAAFQRDVVFNFGLEKIGWKIRGLDSWNGECDDALLLMANRENEISEAGSLPDPLMSWAKFLDRVGYDNWPFLPKTHTGGSIGWRFSGVEELLDKLDSRGDMLKWADERRQGEWNVFLELVSEMGGGTYFLPPRPSQTPLWVSEMSKTWDLRQPNPCATLLSELGKEMEKRKKLAAKTRHLVLGVVGVCVLVLIGAAVWGGVKYRQESRGLAQLETRMSEAGSENLEKLARLEADLKADGGGLFLEKERKELKQTATERLDQALEGQIRSVEKLRKRGDYEGAARICAKIGSCLETRGEDSGGWAEKGRKLRAKAKEIDEALAMAKELLNARNYAEARNCLNDLERMVEDGDEIRHQQMRGMRTRANSESQFVQRWESIQAQAAPGKTLDDWRIALEKLDALAADVRSQPAAEFPTSELMEGQREVLKKRLKTWEDVNKLYATSLERWKQAPPAAKKLVRDEVVKDLSTCLDKLDAIYDENDGQPCGGVEMGKLSDEISRAYGFLRQN